MKLLIIGADSQVGGFLLSETARNHHTLGTSLLGLPEIPALDICQEQAVRAYLHEHHPDYTILTAALTHVDKCEEQPEQARAINFQGPVNVARACREIGSGLAFFSTDYVFDGLAGPYTETDSTNPKSVYARTKLDAENAIRELVPNHLIARTMMVFSYLSGSVNFFMQVFDRARRGQLVTAPGDQFGNPTHAVNLARAVLELVERGATGLYHLSGTTWLDKASFARRIVETLGFDPDLVRAVETRELKQKAIRPLKSGLRTEKAGTMLTTNPLWDLDTALRFTIGQMQESPFTK